MRLDNPCEAGDAKGAASYMLKAADAAMTDALRQPIPNVRRWAITMPVREPRIVEKGCIFILPIPSLPMLFCSSPVLSLPQNPISPPDRADTGCTLRRELGTIPAPTEQTEPLLCSANLCRGKTKMRSRNFKLARV